MKYYLGLDMGTSSVGWAVTDEHYNILRAKGKDLWGIREFDEAQPAADRRMHRVSRRRRQREQVRIAYVKSYFEEAIENVDPNFYQRLDNSKYFLCDKDDDVKTPNGIFADKNYTDKEYFAEYPTIFHLRSELYHSSQPHDVRLVYLAVLNIFKHRGHFLNAGLSSDEINNNISSLYLPFVRELSEKTDISLPQEIDFEEFEDALSNRDYSRTRKSEELIKIFESGNIYDGLDKAIAARRKAAVKEIARMLCGLKTNAAKIFEFEDDAKVEICFSDGDFDEKSSEIIEQTGEEDFAVIELMKQIHDAGLLSGIIRGYSCLSDSRIASYDKHHEDLMLLKKCMKKYCTAEEYDKFFRSQESGTYSAYVNSEGKHRRGMKGRSSEELYKTVSTLLKDHKDDADVSSIFSAIEKDNFLPKQLNASNGVIPNQVHLKELKKILANAEGYLPFLLEKDDSGLSVSERIIALFKFQIPYYIGPVSENSKNNGGNGWVVRRESGPVMPWNINEKIDVHATSEQFITRMVRRCTYIAGEQALPKASLLYQRYCVLNEINNICIDGERISVELKQDLYNDLFCSGKTITRKRVSEYFISKGLIRDDAQISGIDIKINNSLSSYGKFQSVFGDSIKEDKYQQMANQIIFWCTVYGDSKKMLTDRLHSEFGECLSDSQLKRISGFKFKDWGRLSKEFLELQGCEKESGEIISLIQALWGTQYNLMELLNSNEYTFKEELAAREKQTLKSLQEIDADDLNEMYFSAPVKRMVWQTILIIRELEKVLGQAPDKIFVEMTRSDSEKKRSTTRKQKFLDLYQNIKDESNNWKDLINESDASGVLKSKKMYLYLTQMGRSMYTGKHIDLEDLFNDNKYDIDHIYPQSLTKDDNLENNMVLVEKSKNIRKSDRYPLDDDIFRDGISLWTELHRKGFINDEKFKRLTGRKELSEDQLAGFIARQLVETSQATKGVMDLLKQLLPKSTTFVYSKASNVSDFRTDHGFLKSRIINDLHHAKDAYLNIVVGNAYNVRFTQNPYNFIVKEYKSDPQKNHYNLAKIFNHDIKRGSETAWIAQQEDGIPGTIATVQKMMSKNTPLFTRLSFTGHGGIADQTLYDAGKASAEKYIPIKAKDPKMGDVTRYGGLSSVSTAYFFLVEYEGKKGKKIRSLETVPIYLAKKIEEDPSLLEKYCTDELGLVNPSVRIRKIKIQSLVKRNGYLLHITGKTGNRITLRNATNLVLNAEWINYINKLEKSPQNKDLSMLGMTIDENIKLYRELAEKHINGLFSKRPNPLGEKLQKHISDFENLDLEQQCNVLLQILNTTGIVAGGSADLTQINESKNTGLMLFPQKISNDIDLMIVYQSVTGIYQKCIDLRTV